MLHATLTISPSIATVGRHHRRGVATSRRPHPLYWNQARPVRLPLPIILCVIATAHRFGGFGLSNHMKCGECAVRGIDSNLEIYRPNNKVYVRCSRKKKMGSDVCQFKSANLTTLLERIRDRLEHHFLTPKNLAKVIDGVAEVSRPMLEERQTQLARISERKKVVNAEIKNINDVLGTAGAQATSLRSLIDNLANLEKEQADLENEGHQIDEVTEEALLFVNNQAGIIETALDYKTWTNPEDPEAVREFMKIFIEKVEVFELEGGATDQRVVIHYDLRAFKTGTERASATETIYIGKKSP